MKSDKEGVISAVLLSVVNGPLQFSAVCHGFLQIELLLFVMGRGRRGKKQFSLSVFPKFDMWNIFSIQISFNLVKFLTISTFLRISHELQNHIVGFVCYRSLNKAQWFWSKCCTRFALYCLYLIISHISHFIATTLRYESMAQKWFI